MMQMIRTSTAAVVGVLMTLMLISCASSPKRDNAQLPESRPSDFTMGLVVFGVPDSDKPAQRSARYIVEPAGTLRAAFGAGSDGLTFPDITRRLDKQTLDSIWSQISAMGLDTDIWRIVRAPELHHAELGSGQGYLLEIRSDVSFRAWSTDIETDSARALTEQLAGLAWVTD